MRSTGRLERKANGNANISRRRLLIGGATAVVGANLPPLVRALSMYSPHSNPRTSSDSATAKGGSMSHHLDSPIARQDVRLDITDLYAFRGQVGTVFVINVCHSLGKPQIPGYHPEGMYEFKVDLNGDAVEEVTYRFTFGERDEQGKQRYTVRRIRGAE